jgi:aquaporin Z
MADAAAALPRVSAWARLNWTEYAAEAWCLGLFMISASGFGVLLFHPASPVVMAFPSELPRRALMGLAMGLTAILNIYSPWGRRSGAHANPATTLTFLWLGKVAPRDALGYVVAQLAGGVAGTLLAAAVLAPWIADPAVNYVVTMPGAGGAGWAFVAEVAITLVLMLVVLSLVSRPRLAPYTGLVVGFLVFSYITLESPISGMSMNPARTVASALPAMTWTAFWVYLVAPPLGMLTAAAIHRRLGRADHCAKYHHDPAYRCIFCGLEREKGKKGKREKGKRGKRERGKGKRGKGKGERM